jgi:hypothetical protein
MNEKSDCDAVSPLLAELATGAATGHDRDRALRHVGGCAACRQELTELARVADDLLMLTPERQPPTSLEHAVLQRIATLSGDANSPAKPKRWPDLARLRHSRSVRVGVRFATVFMVLALAAFGGAAAAYAWTSTDRHMADRYRETIAAAGAQYPTATPVTATNGDVVGHVFLYHGSPDWVMVSLTSAPESGDYNMVVQTKDGVSYPAGTCVVTGSQGTAGYPLQISAAQVASIELSRPGIQLTAHPLRK